MGDIAILHVLLKGDPFGGHSPKKIFLPKQPYIGVKSCGKSIARIPEA